MPGYRMLAIAAMMAAGWTVPVGAEILSFKAHLSGTEAPTATGSVATGDAWVKIDTDRKRVSVAIQIRGIAVDELWSNLVTQPIGPIHFHQYGSHDHGGDDVVLVLPVPYGPDYHPGPRSFTVTMKDYDYATGAKLLGSDASLDAFIAAIKAGRIILNVHTEHFHDGEISGTVVAG